MILGLCVGYKSICDHKGRMVSLAEIFEKELTSYDYLSNSLHDITNIKIMIKPICNLRDVTIYLEVLDSQNIVVFKDLEFKGNLNKNIEYNIEFNLKISSILSGRTYRYYLEGNKSIFA